MGFARNFDNVEIAFNGPFFGPFEPGVSGGMLGRPYIGDGINYKGPVIIKGVEVSSPGNENVGVLCINADRTADIRQGGCSAEAVTVIPGQNILLNNGEVVKQENTRSHPREALGLNHDDKNRLTLFVAEGHNRRNGVTLERMGEIGKAHGVDIMLELDGGGSSTIVYRNKDGELVIGNIPSDIWMGVLRRIRPVAPIGLVPREN